MRRFSIVLLGAAFLLSSCASVNIVKTENWKDPKIYNATGTLSLVDNGSTELIPCMYNNYAIKATLKNGNKEKQVFLVIDTGTFQNCLSSDVMEYFDNKTDSGYSFAKSFFYGGSDWNSSSPASKGYYFEKLESSGFVIDDVLFQELPDNLYMGRTVEGDKIDGVIGMCALRQLPFRFSIQDRKFTFYKTDKDFPAGEKIPFNKEELPFRLSTELRLTDDITLDALLDTGAFTSIVPEKKIRKFKYTNSVKSFEKIYKNSTESYLVWTKLNFANQTLTNSLLYSRTGISDCSIGTNILENFDFYVSTKDGYGIFVPRIGNEEDTLLEKFIKVSEFGEESFGFTLDSCKVSNLGMVSASRIGEKYVSCVYCIDGKPVITTVEPNDELVSINGISCKDFDWSTYGGLQEADFIFKRGRKEIKLHASRQNYIGDEIY